MKYALAEDVSLWHGRGPPFRRTHSSEFRPCFAFSLSVFFRDRFSFRTSLFGIHGAGPVMAVGGLTDYGEFARST